MKITLVAITFPQVSETFIVSKFVRLVQAGYDVTVVCDHSPASAWASFTQLRGVPDLKRRVRRNWPREPRLKVALLLPLLLIKTFLQAPRQTARYLLRGLKRFGPGSLLRHFYLDAGVIASRPDILHFEFGATAVDRMYLRDLLGCRTVVSFRGYDLNFSGMDVADYYKSVWQSADHLHLLGQDLWARAQRRGCPPGKPHTLIAPAIDAVFFDGGTREFASAAGTAGRPLRLLSVGRLEWKKGYEFSMEAVKLLCDRGIQIEFRIVGGGSYLDVLVFCRHQLQLEAVVTFLGSLPREAIREQLAWADLFVHSAVSEGFCNAVVEAQAMQLPVVASDAGGLPENVAHLQTGYVVPRRDPKMLAEKLWDLCQNAILREDLGRAGRERVLAHFSLDKQVQQFIDLYEAVAG